MADWELIGLFMAIGISVFSLFVSYHTFKSSSRSASYSDLDSLYLEILRIGIENPDFRDPQKTKNYKQAFSKDLIRYETYAHMVWNICETAYDRTKDSQENKETWQPVILSEKQLHYNWLQNKDNHHKFKKEFVDYIESLDGQ